MQFDQVWSASINYYCGQRRSFILGITQSSFQCNKPEGLNPFKTPCAPSNQFLSQFNIKTSSFFMDGHEFHLSTNDLDSLYRKDSKLGYIILRKIEQTIQHLKNSQFLISYLLYDTSSLHAQYKSAVKRIKWARTFLE